jgi:hypothetical protein
VIDDVIKFVSDKSSSTDPKLEKEKHKVDDAVTVDKKHNNNDIQRSEEEVKQVQSTTNTVFGQITELTILDLEYRRA